MADWLRYATCPKCQESNRPGAKPLLEVGDDGAYCNNCGHEFIVQRPRVEAV